MKKENKIKYNYCILLVKLFPKDIQKFLITNIRLFYSIEIIKGEIKNKDTFKKVKNQKSTKELFYKIIFLAFCIYWVYMIFK